MKTLVHLYSNRWTWRGRRFARNLDGKMLLVRAITEAGFTGIKVRDHRRRRA